MAAHLAVLGDAGLHSGPQKNSWGPGIWEFLKELGQTRDFCGGAQSSTSWFVLFVQLSRAPCWDTQKGECHLLNWHYHFLEQLVILEE